MPIARRSTMRCSRRALYAAALGTAWATGMLACFVDVPGLAPPDAGDSAIVEPHPDSSLGDASSGDTGSEAPLEAGPDTPADSPCGDPSLAYGGCLYGVPIAWVGNVMQPVGGSVACDLRFTAAMTGTISAVGFLQGGVDASGYTWGTSLCEDDAGSPGTQIAAGDASGLSASGRIVTLLKGDASVEQDHPYHLVLTSDAPSTGANVLRAFVPGDVVSGTGNGPALGPYFEGNLELRCGSGSFQPLPGSAVAAYSVDYNTSAGATITHGEAYSFDPQTLTHLAGTPLREDFTTSRTLNVSAVWIAVACDVSAGDASKGTCADLGAGDLTVTLSPRGKGSVATWDVQASAVPAINPGTDAFGWIRLPVQVDAGPLQLAGGGGYDLTFTAPADGGAPYVMHWMTQLGVGFASVEQFSDGTGQSETSPGSWNDPPGSTMHEADWPFAFETR